MANARQVATLLAASVVVAACSSAVHHITAPSTTAVPATTTTTTPPSVAASSDSSAFYTPPASLPPGPPGTIIRDEIVTDVPGVPAGATVFRALYKSATIYGVPIAESGYFVVPAGSPPASGWSVLSWAHGTTGVTTSCFPSRFELFGTKTYVLPGLPAFLRAGFVVAATDYEGLTGFEPYLLGASEGRGVLDAARAAAHLPGVKTSGQTVIYGHSQGGHAALFAGELAATYAPDLHVVAVAAAAPATNLSLVVSVAAKTTSAGLLSFQLEAGYSWVHTYRDLPATHVFTPQGNAAAPGLLAKCLPDTTKAIAAEHLTGSDLFAADVSTDPTVMDHARQNDPGRVRTEAPILVVQGTADTTVLPILTDAYVQKMACPIGDTVDYEKFIGATHGSIPFLAAKTVVSFLSSRIGAGSAPATSTCGQPGDSHSVTP